MNRDNSRMKCSAPALKVEWWPQCHEEGNTPLQPVSCQARKGRVMIDGAEHVTTVKQWPKMAEKGQDARLSVPPSKDHQLNEISKTINHVC